MPTLPPRAVVVTRQTDYQRLLGVHATREQARFFLASRGQDIDVLQRRHEAFLAAVHDVRVALPADWRTARVDRDDLDRFLFAPEDVVIAVGQDGLVANLAKYLDGQPVLGVNPEPAVNDGALAPLAPGDVARLAAAAAAGAASLERRAMVRATLEDGQTLRALNEVFVGHRSHQSARYVVTLRDKRETQSSSGVIVSTGTGATGWARSIMAAMRRTVKITPTDRTLLFFVREAWASRATGASVTAAVLHEGQQVSIQSNMNDGGVIFADGIEQDRLAFGWGRTVSVGLDPATLNLVRA